MKRPLLKSFACAFRGLYLTFKAERNFRIHAVVLCLVVALGIYLRLAATQWGLVAFAIGLVGVAELFNTAIERLGDEASGGQQKETVGKVKDIASAAVLLAALTALVIGIIVLFIPLAQKLIDMR
jgi:diacylglycerol kinase (ATP)